ncbi:MAG: large subunit ribosomal protein L19 [Candidatus Krumholzibacteriia bacterium]|jgi:large subunit ribosomal protein L19
MLARNGRRDDSQRANQEAEMNIVEKMRANGLRDDLPDFNIGDTVNIAVRIKEGEKTRIQNFTGALIASSGTGTEESITVRKISGGIAVERIFPVQSPNVSGIEVMKRGRIRRAKLYYLRERTGKKARIREARR